MLISDKSFGTPPAGKCRLSPDNERCRDSSCGRFGKVGRSLTSRNCLLGHGNDSERVLRWSSPGARERSSRFYIVSGSTER